MRKFILLRFLFILIVAGTTKQVSAQLDVLNYGEYSMFVQSADLSGPTPITYQGVDVQEVISWVEDSTKVYYVNTYPTQFFIDNTYLSEILLYTDSSLNQIRIFRDGIFCTDSICFADNTEILYDFNQMPGDTINAYLLRDSDRKPIILSYVDTLIYNGIPRKTLHYLDNFGQEFNTIQGIGSSQGLVTNYNYGMHTYGYLWCAFFDFEAVSSYGECYLSVGEKQTDIKVFPNPFSNELNIQFDQIAKGEIIIYDLQGKICHSQNINALSSSLSLGALDSGIYIFQVTNENGVVVSNSKIVKE